MKFKRYTEIQLRYAVANNFSFMSVLKELNLIPAGGNYITLKKAIKHCGLDISHFTGKGHLKNKTHRYNTKPISEILVYGNYICSHQLKKRLIREDIKTSECESCHLNKWLDQEMPLELHHIDGDRLNNVLNNIKLLCPNCHAQTDNYRGKKLKISK